MGNQFPTEGYDNFTKLVVPRWTSTDEPTIRANNVKFHDAIRAAGGKPDLVNLPEMGIQGNSHMMMMDRNNQQIAQVIQQWVSDKGFVR